MLMVPVALTGLFTVKFVQRDAFAGDDRQCGRLRPVRELAGEADAETVGAGPRATARWPDSWSASACWRRREIEALTICPPVAM